ncbi:MAG: hypothetical protein CVU44_08015 [Chloroflexi bacterium HGW-Chloroflexi-6]|nr:MAG: hypothetical protein CVU44_08015 [Chloroflexi bacterium HGW-Chloroflexi-6]
MPNIFLRLHCPSCGKNISDSDNLCPHCGANLDAPLEKVELEALVRQCLEKAEKSLESGRNLKEALASCNQAIEYAPESAEAHNMRGLILDAIGKTDESILAYQEAIRLNPDFAEAKENLADAKLDLPTPTQDERVMAALSHASALLPMMGVIAPIVIWVTQKEKSKYVAFQSLQALAYQLSMILAYFVGMGCYMFSFFGTFFSIPFLSSSGSSESANPLFMLMFAIPFLVMGVLFIGGFLFVIYGAIGAVMTFQGKPFRYMFIGKRVEHFMQPEQGVGTNQ